MANGDDLAWFFDTLWMPNTLRYSQPFAIYVICTGDGIVPDFDAHKHRPLIKVDVLGDLGHCGALLNGSKPYHFCGGSAAFLTMAMLAYMNECDFIFKEQDVLVFGPYIEAMYRDMGNKGIIFGSQQCMPCANSITLIRHSFIPTFVKLYLDTPPENTPDQMAECKFDLLSRQHPEHFARYSFGVDRDRPFDVKAPVWYAQKFTREELMLLHEAGLVDLGGNCPHPKVFSNS